MFIDPASNVSVPPTVVMRTRSKVPERVFAPETKQHTDVDEPEMTPCITQVFDPIQEIIIDPLFVFDAPPDPYN